MELFLKPFADRPGMTQIALASDAETLVLWYDCAEQAGFACVTKAEEIPGGWQATLRIPLAPILASADGSGTPEWCFFVGFSVPVSADGTEWASWQRDHDAEGAMTDPLFIDPRHGDFRLRPDSPALALGFVPFDVSQCGPRTQRSEPVLA